MLHFPSSSNGPLKKHDSRNLNATQQKSSSDPMFLKIEEELHDARRVQQHGQEDDLRMALSMVITRVSEMSTLLSETYKTQADLEVQLNVAKSNLQLVIANNEMLEEALKSGNGNKDVGWRRSRESRDSNSTRTNSVDIPPAASRSHVNAPSSEQGHASSPISPALHSPSTPPPPTPATPAPPQQSDGSGSRFFKFRFASSSSTSSNSSSKPPSRPMTPTSATPPTYSPNANQNPYSGGIPTSASVPSLPEHIQNREKEIESLMAELEKERTARKAVLDEKAALEAELESLSQALFEEANKMVSQERIKRFETEEELKEARQQKQALRDALRVVESEVEVLRSTSSATNSPNPGANGPMSVISALQGLSTRSRSSSQVALKSPPRSRSGSVESVVRLGVDGELIPVPDSAHGGKEKGKDQAEEQAESEDVKLEDKKYAANVVENDTGFDSEPREAEKEKRHSLITGGAPESLDPPSPYHSSPLEPGSAVPISTAYAGLGLPSDEDEPSPWADVPSSSSASSFPQPAVPLTPAVTGETPSMSIYSTALGMR
ncbi:hypothetical protein K435DRAFT_964552 [Dendrothele bispora CBS 962.96]|uniref:GDP/GTP exchange factor Sec2 N-terminal domain-containing protein n=1 Tax=Dendrothele bispora (strain CBS 962.96) TaxID=1314807 RepID=A0A4V4HGK8_DENBC|nr:hypothetical protein K435DRAFT_964552 [Dendrothele bispora CBS 962.96]